MTSKEKYRLLCSQEDSIPLFSKDWWLDMVCGKDWDIILVEEKGKILATLPYFSPLSSVITMPFYTQTMGVWTAPIANDTKYSSLLARNQKLAADLIDGLPQYSSFLQNFNYSFTDWLPFYWKGFSQTTRYTYIISDIQDEGALWKNMSSNVRRNITKAKEKQNLQIQKGISADDFLKVQALTFQRQGLKMKESPALLKKLIDKCRERGCGDTWGAYDKEGNLHAAIFVAWQKSSAYYIAGGGNPSFRDSGAHSLLIWESIKFVRSYTNTYDFEGSMLSGVERFFREFGAIQTPFFTIFRGKMSLFNRICLRIKRMMNESKL